MALPIGDIWAMLNAQQQPTHDAMGVPIAPVDPNAAMQETMKPLGLTPFGGAPVSSFGAPQKADDSGGIIAKLAPMLAGMKPGGGSTGPTNPLTEGVDPANDAGFLWKPESDSGGLVVLTPGGWGDVRGVSINGEEGRFTGYANPFGGVPRGHFRFSQSGSGYGPSPVVTFTMADGSTRNITIPDGSQRYGVGYPS